MIYVISSNTLYSVYTRILFAISIIFLKRFMVILNYVEINFGYYRMARSADNRSIVKPFCVSV